MYIDPIIYQLSENLDPERFVIATYYCQVPRSVNIVNFGAALAVEQTCGTWVKVPGETDEVRERCIGRVVGVYETPAYQNILPKEVSERNIIVRIAYPFENFGASFSMLITTVIGNISASGKVKLLDLEFPKSYLKNFQGPKFGVKGVREILGVYDRPLVNNMIKPCTGLTPKETAKLAYDAAFGGIDIIKDDELVQSPYWCDMSERVKYCQDAINEADAKTGEKTLMAYNITDRTEKLLENAHKALDAGAEMLMINYNTAGLDSARMIAEDPTINVPILGHSDYTGAVYASDWSGMSAKLICGKLPRLAGMDMAITMSPYGKFPMIMDTFVDVGLTCISEWPNIEKMFPMPGGGTTQGHIEDIMNKFGNDVIISAGGAVHGHPMGSIAGAQAFRQGIDAVKNGYSLQQAMEFEGNEALKVALDSWGIYGVTKKDIFDLNPEA